MSSTLPFSIHILYSLSEIPGAHNGLSHPYSPFISLHIVHTHKGTSRKNSCRRCHQSSLLPLLHRKVQCKANHGFPGRPQQHRIAEALKGRQVFNHFQIHFIGLSKSHARVQDDSVILYTSLLCKENGLVQLLHHRIHEMVPDRALPVVHEAAAHSQPCDGPGHILILLKPPYIVDHGCSCLHCQTGHFAFAGIHGNGDIKIVMNQPDNGENPLHFLFFPHRLMAGTGGLPSHIYDVSAVQNQFLSLPESRLPVTVPASVGKGIRRYVQNPHDIGPVPHIKFFLSYNHPDYPLTI